MVGCEENLPLLAEKRHYSGLKYGYARGFEAFQYVENIRRYHSSIMNHQRVEEQKVQALQLSKQQAQESQLLEASPIAPFTDKMLTQPEQSNEVIKE
ncbi:membrane-bound lytic transglycosylase F [Actinobacillus equuli]|nr:membrane-bound lytic transglycosylase F [Actinobacillus equuli]